MRICDICKSNGVRYELYATTSEDGNDYKLELCGLCYTKFQQKKRYHGYLAYKETVTEIAGEAPKKKSWLDRFKR